MGKPTVLVLTSGGLDSTACIAHYLTKGFAVDCLFIEYGQPALIQESSAVDRISEHYGLSVHRVAVRGMPKFGRGEVLGRNALLVAIAFANFKWKKGLISLGIHSGTAYADCSPEFLRLMQRTIDLQASGRIQLDAPFIKWSKAEIYHFAVMAACPIELTYSCETGGTNSCGLCDSCRDREVICASTQK